MASVKNIEIEINKEVAKQAYEAGARCAFGDDDGILTIEGFDEYWDGLQERVKAISSNESAALPLHDVSNNEALESSSDGVAVCPECKSEYWHTCVNGRRYCEDCGFDWAN